MKKAIFLLFIFLTLLITASNSHAEDKTTNTPARARNIILLIGDGMGIAQLQAAMIASKESLNIESFKNIGLTKTYASDSFLTDSGAAGTALATGFKTYNGAIGVDSDTTPRPSVLQYAAQSGRSTGIVVTCAITHATPAAFYAHQKSRELHEEIAAELVSSGIDLFIGGGLKYFENRKDETDLMKCLSERGYQIARNINELENIRNGKLAGLFYKNHPPKISEGRADMLGLSTQKAIELLNKNPEGFFLMIEGSQIDWGGHDQDTDYIIEEMIDFDKVVGLALDFAKLDENTLVIVTADHETGGMALINGDLSKGIVNSRYTTDDHTAIMVPVFAYGPGSDHFIGIYDNTDIFHKMMLCFGIEAKK